MIAQRSQLGDVTSDGAAKRNAMDTRRNSPPRREDGPTTWWSPIASGAARAHVKTLPESHRVPAVRDSREKGSRAKRNPMMGCDVGVRLLRSHPSGYLPLKICEKWSFTSVYAVAFEE